MSLRTHSVFDPPEKPWIRKLAKTYTRSLVGSWSPLRSIEPVSVLEDYSTLPRTATEKSMRPPLRENSNVANLPQLVDRFKTLSVEPREVVFKNLKGIGLKDLLGCVCGGPLERVEHLDSSGGSVVKLRFMRASDAAEFYEFSQTGLFIVCGKRVKVSWGSGQYKEVISEADISSGACRCLIIKRALSKKNESRVFSDVDTDDIKKDFERFGPIVEICPLISSKVCFSIHYFNATAAMAAMRLMDDPESEFHAKYRKWGIWYGKDITDKPCFRV